MSFNADYFRKHLAEDIDLLKDSPFSVEITLTNGERYHLVKVLSIRDTVVTIQVYPKRGKLQMYSKEDREAGMPPFLADALTLQYSRIEQVRLHKDEKKTRPAIGFSAEP